MQVLHTHSHLALSQQASSRARSARPLVLRAAASGGQQNGNRNERNNYNVRKGKQFENSRRRRGRPAHLRSPYDSPLRDGNRDRLIGLLTERAAKTLMVYLMETNANVYSWLVEFYKKNPIPKNGSWDEVSGETFLRKLLSMPIEEAKFNTGRDSLFDNVSSCGVDPRSIAQRIMDIRTQLSEEFIQELQAIAEENSLLLRETLTTSLSSSLDAPPAAGSSKDGAPVHPELADTPPPTTTASSSSSKDGGSSSSSNGASKGGSSSRGAVSTPPPSPTPAAPKRTPEPAKGSASSSSSSNAASSKKDAADAAGKAAAVAALNAALSKPPVAGAGSTSSSSSSSDEKVDMADVLAQLRRAMEADVARDVMKMKEATTSSSSASTEGSSPAAPASTPTPLAAEAAAAAPEKAAGTDSPSPTEPPAPAPAAEEEPDTPAPVSAEAAAAAAADGSSIPEAAAGVQASLDEDSGSSSSVVINTQLSSSAVGEAGTYSRMLPKGWGPRLGVGFSRYPRSRNNIVSSANLGALKPPGAAGDALSGSTAASEAV